MSKKCVKCDKAVYPGDPQINLDGNLLHKKCAKCADCNGTITVGNFNMSKDSEGKVFLLCLTHYKARFAKTGIYQGADKFQKKSSAETLVANSASAGGGETTPSKVIKSTIWSPQGPSQQPDTDYTLERSVTTPDRRPSLKAGTIVQATQPVRRESNGAALLKERRQSLKATDSKAVEDIADTARRASISGTKEAAAATATAEATAEATKTCQKEGCACENCSCEDCTCGTASGCGCGDNCTCGPDCKCGKAGDEEGASSCCAPSTDAEASTTEKAACCDSTCDCNDCGGPNCKCTEDCGCAKKEDASS
jgi:hypothetical protein